MKDSSYCKSNNASNEKWQLQAPRDGGKMRNNEAYGKISSLPHPNRTSATESWRMVSMPACPEFPDFLIFQKMMQFRDLYKISPFLFYFASVSETLIVAA